MAEPRISNPKRGNSAGWYNYYAGYSSAFVEDTLTALQLPRFSPVLDPWNGTGTTTAVAESLNLLGLGFDANPALVLVSKGRSLEKTPITSLAAILKAIIQRASSDEISRFEPDCEPLSRWFEPVTARMIRNFEISLQQALIDSEGHQNLGTLESFSSVSKLASFFYVVLFGAIKKIVGVFSASNPTWIKSPTDLEKLSLDTTHLQRCLNESLQEVVSKLDWQSKGAQNSAQSLIDLGNSEKLDLPDQSIRAVVSSPPYCTRIDYVIATLPELSVLGYSTSGTKALRDKMIGTPTMRKHRPESCNKWGTTCLGFLDTVESHKSKASSTYYRSYFLQYFESMWRSISEIGRVLMPNGDCVLVVQDSYYKDVHNDLAQIVTDFSEAAGLALKERIDFKVSRTMAGVHKWTRGYRETFGATESALFFKKNPSADSAG